MFGFEEGPSDPDDQVRYSKRSSEHDGCGVVPVRKNHFMENSLAVLVYEQTDESNKFKKCIKSYLNSAVYIRGM